MKQEFSFIIQARTESSRLRGKISLPFYKDKTILEIQLNNIQTHFPGSSIILATTTNKADDVIEEKYAKVKGLKLFRGDEDNVLKRFIDAAYKFNIENIVRICSDNPFLSMPYLAKLIDYYFEVNPDYASYQFSNKIPAIRSHSGLFAEVVSLKALEKTKVSTQDALYTEHVTNFIYGHPEEFKLNFLPVPEILNDYIDKLRLTIDTLPDFTNIQKLYLAVLNKYGSDFTLNGLLSEVNKDKELLRSMNELIRNYGK